MISYKASVAQKWFLFDLYDRQWSLTKPRSPKYVSYLDSMIVNDLLQILGLPKNVFIWSLSRFESMSFIANILACKLKIVKNRNWKLISKKDIVKW